MAAPNEKLAESLDVLKALQEGGRRVFRSDDLSRVHRERLVENGFLQDVMKGWLISSSPGAREGDSTPCNDLGLDKIAKRVSFLPLYMFFATITECFLLMINVLFH
jgi:hypothetical protein